MKFSTTLAQTLALFAFTATAAPVGEPNLAKRDDVDSSVEAQFFWKTKTVSTTVPGPVVTVTNTKTGIPTTVTVTGQPETVYTTVYQKPDHKTDKHKRDEAEPTVDAQFFWKKTTTVTITAPPVTTTDYVKVPGGTITTKIPGGTVTQTVTKDKKNKDW
ncbi:hypothetical protein WICPIJ_004268 [Wickerhamomyces pijperi]|uniref:Uncharacterized protein n=1 Tax=Wickerhamomyces pijperi TaxID=599730 RepID=A0A9P8Q5L8_WICPI|nr:hypothetical protein WICPIJ_004268 [Wickerhamomyces pijperi]